MCSRDVILELLPVRWELSAQVRSTVERAGCGRTCRARRAGKHVNARRHCIAYSETSDGKIPVLSTTCRRRSNSSAGRVGDRDLRDVVLRRVTTHSTTTDMAVNGEQPISRSSVDYRPSIYVINAAAITITSCFCPHRLQVSRRREARVRRKLMMGLCDGRQPKTTTSCHSPWHPLWPL